MTDYTPTTEDVRRGYAWQNKLDDRAEFRAAFDRWLAAHDAALRAEWEVEHHVQYRVIRDPQNPYLATVHRVEKPEPGDQVTHIIKTLTERVPIEQGGENQ